MIRILIIYFLFCNSLFVWSQNADQLLLQMFDAVTAVNSLEFTQFKKERVNGKLLEQQIYVKMTVKPFQVYLKVEKPEPHQEVLFIKGKNGNNALINPASFPWVNVNLDPFGDLMRENQHHTVYENGFGYTVDLLKSLLNKYGDDSKNFVAVKRELVWNDFDCYEIELNNPNFGYKNYTVLAGEDLVKIGDKLGISEHMVVELNPNVDDYYDVDEGQIIRIPVDYAKSMIILLDKKTMLPVSMKVYDDRGLYEVYEYRKLNVNPKFKPEEFTEDYPDYGF